MLRRRLARSQVIPVVAKIPACIIGMETCSSAHHWARELERLGHRVRLIPPQNVKPYVKRNKTDAADAETISEVVGRAHMRFVPIKTLAQQSVLALHRTRSFLVRQRTVQLVAERASELKLWERYLSETAYVGEVGLDAGPRFYRSFEQQKQVFKRVLECCADAGGKVLTIHSVRATGAVLDLIEAHLPPDRARAVLHWLTGSKAEVRRAANLGCYFSVNAEMARTERGRAIVAAMPADRILTETDGPFTRVGDRPTAPADAIHAVAALSVTRGLSEDVSRSLVEGNLRTLLGSIRAESVAWERLSARCVLSSSGIAS